jgi:hypothetical protein
MRVSSTSVTNSDNLLPWEHLKSYYHLHERDMKGEDYNVRCIICDGSKKVKTYCFMCYILNLMRF